MIILACNGVALSFGTNTVLENISFNIQKSEKVGLVGVNGAGKSTLFKILVGSLQPDQGEIFTARGYKAGYLEQNSGLDSSNTIWEELVSVYCHLREMAGIIKNLEHQISVEKNPLSLDSLMKRYGSLTEKFARNGGYEYNGRVKGVLRGLGFDDCQFEHSIQTLSGGQKTRLSLAKLLLEEPDILLLDEPTNHLDIQAVEWLEDFLKGYEKSVFIISHDRYFLDMVTSKTIELENCRVKMYNGNYSEFVRQKSLDREIQQKHFELQQKEIARMEAFIEQQRRWNREKNIVAAESRQKAIDRIQKINQPSRLPDKIHIKFQGNVSSGNDVLFVEDLAKEYPGKPLFSNLTFKIHRNERVFLLGPNGCGKTTLLKILAGKLAESGGLFEYGHKVNIGYYDQEQENLDTDNSLLEEVWDSNEKLTQTEVRNALASFLFKGEDVFKSVSVLSGGEKSRMALIKLMLSGSNFLILDEPTNHLDMQSREVLEEALSNFDGTLLVVSHDRYFINKLATRILSLSKDSILDCSGNYSFYLETRAKLDHNSDTLDKKLSPSKLERIADKEEKTKKKRLERQLADTEEEINALEIRQSRIETEMEEASSDHVRLTELHEEQAAKTQKLDELYSLWEDLSAQ